MFDAVLARLEALIPLAPLHQPHNLAPIRSIRTRVPQLSQVACFDTAFHASLPELSRRFAIPESLYQKGIRRYDFHGLSTGTRPGQLDPGVVLHLAQQGMAEWEIEHLLYHDCGMPGLSELSGDVRDLLASPLPTAAIALDHFAWQTAKAFAGLTVSMGAGRHRFPRRRRRGKRKRRGDDRGGIVLTVGAG